MWFLFVFRFYIRFCYYLFKHCAIFCFLFSLSRVGCFLLFVFLMFSFSFLCSFTFPLLFPPVQCNPGVCVSNTLELADCWYMKRKSDCSEWYVLVTNFILVTVQTLNLRYYSLAKSPQIIRTKSSPAITPYRLNSVWSLELKFDQLHTEQYLCSNGNTVRP